MANMEKIIRPHLPANIAPTDTSAKTPDAQNIVAQFPQTSSASTGWTSMPGGFNTAKDRYETKTSSHSYYVKCYMRKREKENTKRR